MIFLVSQFLFILFVLIGIIVWALSDRPLALREIAINTRRNGDVGSSYTMLKVLSVCLKILTQSLTKVVKTIFWLCWTVKIRSTEC